jgi:orotate phosphoribosyltransferase
LTEGSNERRRLLDLLVQRSYAEGRFTLASGAESSAYVDARLTTMHAEGQALVGRLGLAAIRDAGWRPDAVGGLTMGADPIAYAIAHASAFTGEPVHAFSVRKEPKAHGRGRRVEGCLEPGHRAVVVEDVLTTGGSALRACQAVSEVGATVVGVLVLVDREEGGRAALETAGYPVRALFTISELREAAARARAG